MRNFMRNIGASLTLLLASVGTAVAVDINLAPSNVGFHNPIGIDFQETTGNLVLSVNYPLGTPNNLELADPLTGTAVIFAPTLSGLTNELKIATVRASPCRASTSFNVGEVFTGNGNAGQVIRVSANGGVVTNPWVSLPGEPALVRGSLFQDRFNSAGCDLIVVTGNEQTGFAANDNVGNVWRVTSNATPSLVATIGTHLEGVTTVPNVPAIYGPLAGRIIAGAEQYLVNGSAPTGYSSYDPAGGQIVAVDPSGGGFFTIGGPGTVGISGTSHHYVTNTNFHPEDLDIIRANADFFGVAFRDGVILESKPSANVRNFTDRCGQILITQEFPKVEANVSHSGLYALRWDAVSGNFIVDELTAAISGISGSQVQQWEHTTFTSGTDCATTLTVAKTPDNGTFKIGDQLTWTIVVTNTGVLTAGDVKLNDQLPLGPGGDLTWSVFSTSAGSCSIDATQKLHCDLGDIAASGSVTVVVKSSNVNGAPADDCTGVKINNTATASANNAQDASDSGDTTCVPPPSLKIVKSPKSGTFAQGAQLTYTMVVSNGGPGSATGVTLSDQLPGAGGLTWTSVSTTQGSCTLSANLLSCSLGTIPSGGSVTVTVKTDATTPLTACQDQPNPKALATDNQGESVQDSGDQTCTPVNLVTVTQGGWGAPAHGNNPGTVLNAYFAGHPGYKPMIGDITNACSGKTLTFTSANAIRAFLPAGGTPGVLNATATNPTSSSAGVFAGQVLALTLNTQVLSSGNALLNFVLPSGPAAGKTVGQVLADADKALGGCGLPSYVTSISQLNDIVDSINNMFD